MQANAKTPAPVRVIGIAARLPQAMLTPSKSDLILEAFGITAITVFPFHLPTQED